MKFGGRNSFQAAFAIVFTLAVTTAIFHASWTRVPSVNSPSVNLEGSKEPVQPIVVRTVSIVKKSPPPLPSGPELMKYEFGPGMKIVPPYLPLNHSASRQ
jgi:hypothetical protein